MKKGRLILKARKLLTVLTVLGFVLLGTDTPVIFGAHLTTDLDTVFKQKSVSKEIDLGQAFINAFESNDESLMQKLVRENRNIVPNELINMINYATSGEVNTAEMEWIIRVSKKMGTIYRAEFSDRRLEEFVSNYRKWSVNEQRKKKEADEIFYSYIKDMKNRNYDAVVAKWDDSLEIYREIGDKLCEAKRLDEIGIAFGRLGSFETSIRILNDARKIHHEIGNVMGEVSNLRYVATGYIALNDYRNAVDAYESALHIVLEIGDKAQGLALQEEIEGLEGRMKRVLAATDSEINQ